MVKLTCAAGRMRRPRGPGGLPMTDMFEFRHRPGRRPPIVDLCPICRLPVAVLVADWSPASDLAFHVAHGRPPGMTMCCGLCGGHAPRGLPADPSAAGKGAN